MPRTTAHAAALVSLPEIAALARVQRPVVTNWRRRFPDFPPPTARTASQELFDVEAVVTWLGTRELGNADREQLNAERVLYTVVARAARHEPRLLLALLTALLCLRAIDGDEPLVPERGADVAAAWTSIVSRAARVDELDEFLLTEVRDADSGALELAILADDCTEAAYGTSGAFEWLLARRSKLGVADLIAGEVSALLADLMARLSGVDERSRRQNVVTIADPEAGPGDVLAALARAVDEEARAVFVAAEPDRFLARLARRRLLVHGVGYPDFDVQEGGELNDGMGNPDVIVARLPYQPGETRNPIQQLDRIEQLALLLDRGRSAVIHGPAEVLVGGLAGGRGAGEFRARLLKQGIVEAIVRLPGGMVPYRPGYKTALWILTRDPVPAARGRVLILDVSGQALTAETCAQLAEDILIWRREGFTAAGHDQRFGSVCDVADLLSAKNAGTALGPSRRLTVYDRVRVVPEHVARIAEAEDRLELAAERARADLGTLRGNVARRITAPPERVTLGALAKAKRLLFQPGANLSDDHLTPRGTHPVLGPAEVLGLARPGERRIDRQVLLLNYGHVLFTEAGDLVVTENPEFGVLIDEVGVSVVQAPARILRVLRQNGKANYTPHVLAALLREAPGTTRARGAVRADRRLEEYELLDLPEPEMLRFHMLLTEQDRRRKLLTEQFAALNEVAQLTTRGVADGALIIAGPAHPRAQHPTNTKRSSDAPT